jgi:DNA topoisomerase-1
MKKKESNINNGDLMLFIVESPTKSKTINSILRSFNYKVNVLATLGHIKDLPVNNLGVKVEENFKPIFLFLPYKKKVIENILNKLKDNVKVIIATDPDREGEAIAFHVYNEIKNYVKLKNIKNIEIKRAFINEITYNGIKKGLSNLGDINMSMVVSQFARRVSDRLIGYRISPVLWGAFRLKNLSAGRVQTATLKLIVDKEKEILNFKPRNYYTFKVIVEINNKKVEFNLVDLNKELVKVFENERDKLNFIEKNLKELLGKELKFDLRIEDRFIKPLPPLKTSTLQQEAAKLGFSASKTMLIAQKLFEGIKIKDKHLGLITYHRTDSIRVSKEGIELAKSILKDIKIHRFSDKSMFDAHEAIRITYNIDLDLLKKYLTEEEFIIYLLIYNRFLAAFDYEAKYYYQIIKSDSLFNYQDTDIFLFYDSGKIYFKGFLRFLPDYIKNFSIFSRDYIDLKPGYYYFKIIDFKVLKQKENPPSRYSISSIIKKMEETGIGRPSTYASTINTLLKRNYIQIKKNIIYPTELGIKVCDFLINKYNDLLDIKFTAFLESKLDEIEKSDRINADKLYIQLLNEIYNYLIKNKKEGFLSKKKNN